ncbi:hypothetical protein ON010_g14365 [Phytophthora cinnamomi]|nr:hypothetical protein ON010_g14365 [Phytophthora cinnamomi]
MSRSSHRKSTASRQLIRPVRLQPASQPTSGHEVFRSTPIELAATPALMEDGTSIESMALTARSEYSTVRAKHQWQRQVVVLQLRSTACCLQWGHRLTSDRCSPEPRHPCIRLIVVRIAVQRPRRSVGPAAAGEDSPRRANRDRAPKRMDELCPKLAADLALQVAGTGSVDMCQVEADMTNQSRSSGSSKSFISPAVRAACR